MAERTVYGQMVLRQMDIYMQKPKNELDLNKKKSSVGEDIEKLEPQVLCENVKWYCYFEKHFGLFSTGSMEGAPGKKEVPSVPEILKKKRRDFMELKIKHRRKMFA